MSKDWKELTDDDLLNDRGTQSAEVIARYQRIMDRKTIEAMKEIAASQRKLQLVTVFLTVVIVISTGAYTWITWQSVQVQREANQIQREARDAEAKAKLERPSNPTVERDARKSVARPTP